MKKTICFILILVTLFITSGCFKSSTQSGNNKKDSNNIDQNGNYIFNPEYNYQFYDTAESIIKTRKFKADTYNYSINNISVTEDALANFIQFLNSEDTVYEYEAYYMLLQAMELYNKNSNLTLKHDNILLNITVEELMKRVKINNAAYKKQKDEEKVGVFYTEFSDTDLERYCSIVAKTVNFYLQTGKVKNADEIKCILGDLKILSKPSVNNAFVSDDNALIISPNMIEALKIKDINGNQDVELSTIAHETMHIIQKGCNHRQNQVYCLGNAYNFDELNVNPLFYNWFYEGAAEKLTINIAGGKPLVYEYHINYINSLTLSCILNKANKVFDIEESTFDKSLEHLFGIFGCTDEKQKSELLKMIFSIDIIQTEDEDFINAVDKDMPEEKLVKIKRNLKNSVNLTLTKHFYKNLATLINQNSLKLNDIFYLITVFEQDINSHIRLNKAETLADAKNFVDSYTKIQDEFFTSLTNSQKLTADEIAQRFLSYGLVNSSGEANVDFSFLSEEKQKLFGYILNTTYFSDFKNIRSFK